jgi:L-galactonate dehydratase
LRIAREVVGYDKGNVIMIDANQIWSVPEAIEYMRSPAEFRTWTIEEPISHDDVLGHATVRKSLRGQGGVATGK